MANVYSYYNTLARKNVINLGKKNQTYESMMLNFRCGTILSNLRQILVSFFHISEVIGK